MFWCDVVKLLHTFVAHIKCQYRECVPKPSTAPVVAVAAAVVTGVFYTPFICVPFVERHLSEAPIYA